jgi:pimeloyl-ACP methyl ester carboxylesterase
MEAFLHTGRQFKVRASGRTVVGWRWGPRAGAAPVVYLAHGWGSRGGGLSVFAEPLLAAGYAVVTWDAPGHGASGRGMSSMPEFARGLMAVVASQGPAHAVVAHSMGASATALAASWGFAARHYAFIAPAADPPAFASSFGVALGARPEVMAQARARSERRLRFSWSDLDVCALAAEMTAPLLVVHDRHDHTIPFAEGEAIAAAWPGARLLETTGLGHHAVARDPEVVAEVLEFVTGGNAMARLAAGDEQALLDRYLFEPEARWR